MSLFYFIKLTYLQMLVFQPGQNVYTAIVMFVLFNYVVL